MVNAIQQHMVRYLRDVVKNGEAIIGRIRRGARYRVKDRDTTGETLVEYNARVTEARKLIAKIDSESEDSVTRSEQTRRRLRNREGRNGRGFLLPTPAGPMPSACRPESWRRGSRTQDDLHR